MTSHDVPNPGPRTSEGLQQAPLRDGTKDSLSPAGRPGDVAASVTVGSRWVSNARSARWRGRPLTVRRIRRNGCVVFRFDGAACDCQAPLDNFSNLYIAADSPHAPAQVAPQPSRETLLKEIARLHEREAAWRQAGEQAVATFEEWYAQDQGEVIGDENARRAAHREVAAVEMLDALLRADGQGEAQ